MLLSQLPKINAHFAAAIISLSSPTLHTRCSHFLVPNLKLNMPSSYPFHALKSTLASQVPLLTDIDESEEPEKPVELSLEKVFIPPDTDISSVNESLTARVLKGSNIVLSRYARDAQETTAEFVKSSMNTDDFRVL